MQFGNQPQGNMIRFTNANFGTIDFGNVKVLDKNDVANGLQLQYINTKNELTTAYEKYLNDRKNIELTKRIYDKTLIKFNEGLASSRDITDNLNQYLTAQSNMYNSILTLISAKNKLQKLNNTL